MKIYGPYKGQSGRKHIIIIDGSSRKTISYPKWLMQNHLGRILESWETIDHINRDFTDDRLENLRVVERSQHTKDDAVYAKSVTVICVWCGEQAIKRPSDLRGNSKQGKAGPFCNKSCAGKYGAELQNGRVDKFPAQPSVNSEYYQKDKT